MKKTLLCSALLATTNGAVSAETTAEHSGFVAITSNYVDSGITMSDDDTVLQATYNYLNGNVYGGLFVSGVEDGEEVQLFGGYTTSVEDVVYKVGMTSYIYTEHDFSENFLELNLAASTDILGANMSVMVDYSEVDSTAEEIHSGADDIKVKSIAIDYSRYSEFLWGTEFHGELGYTSYSGTSERDYSTHWQLGISKEIVKDVMLSIDYFDTDNSEYGSDDHAILSLEYHF